jgi:hypothetical protein
VAEDRPISPLILAEYYDAGDPGVFLQHLLAYRGNWKPLLGIIERWKRDRSPRATKLKLRFALEGKLTPEIRVVFKRLFKQAWHDQDHELMGAFMARLDGALRRSRVKRHRWVNRTVETTEHLRLQRRGAWPVFSTATTHYLRRRAWRYFRRLGFRDPAGYPKAVAAALARYDDDAVRAGENLLDNWGLMHACFGKSEVLAFNKRHTNVRGPLANLQAAPMFERHWAQPTAAPVLLDLLLSANCRPVRVWSIQLLRRHHGKALAAVDAAMLLRLIDHADADVAAFAASLLEDANVAGTLPVATWVRLLATENATVVASVAAAFRKHVVFDRVTTDQAAEIATSAAVPVAALGMEILEQRPVRSDADRDAVATLAGARCEAIGQRIVRFALGVLNVPKVYEVRRVVAFFDSRLKSMRAGGFAALADDSPAATDPAFWAALMESPYDDVRTALVARLEHSRSLPGAREEVLAGLWQSVLLNIHRGGRAKLIALRQLSDAIVRRPEVATTLLPVLAVAIRSVRAPEARHGLAAIVAAVEREPGLAEAVQRALPELRLDAAIALGGAA